MYTSIIQTSPNIKLYKEESQRIIHYCKSQRNISKNQIGGGQKVKIKKIKLDEN